jgi:hypothetical protein
VVTGELKKLNNEEFNDLYSLPNIVRGIKSRTMRGGRAWSMDWERRGSFGGKPEEKRPLGRPRRRWKDNIKMDLQKLGCGDMAWMEMAQDRDR